jgi:hypothetical protein
MATGEHCQPMKNQKPLRLCPMCQWQSANLDGVDLDRDTAARAFVLWPATGRKIINGLRVSIAVGRIIDSSVPEVQSKRA